MSVLDTLEICFQASLNGVDAQLNALAEQLGALDGAAAKAEGAMNAAGRNLAQSLGSGFSGATSELKRRIDEAGGACSAWMSAAVGVVGAQEKGRLLSRQFAQGVLSGSASIGSAAKQAVASAKFDGGTAAARSAGRALSEGFAQGVRERSGAVNAAVSAMVSSATRKIRSLLSIHSPSKVTQALGANFGEGFSLGVMGSISGAERAAAALSDAANNGLRASGLPDMGGAGDSVEARVERAVDQALGSVQLTIPLQVDGMKLGEASIRGINAVTRSAGRVLLKL